MKQALLLFLLVWPLAINSLAQSSTGKALVGTWKVIKADIANGPLPAAEKKEAEKMKSQFLNARFLFKDGNHCSFECSVPDLQIRDGFWKLTNSMTIEIREWKDRSSLLMKIFVSESGSSTRFTLDETPFLFTVIKE